MPKPKTSAAAPAGQTTAATSSLTSGESIRESVEAVVVAIILTLTFRTFLGENYQIPTGSMAPTLQGRHMDMVCPECGFEYRTGASQENEDNEFGHQVTATCCPICRYRVKLDKKNDLNQRSFGGDRIIVSKLAYVFDEPNRWDVFVFKYPGNPKINYIKRLVGLPGETLLIRHGDVFTTTTEAGTTEAGTTEAAGQPTSLQPFRIARKPAEKVLAMLQPVDDTYYVSEELQEVGWPLRWNSVTSAGAAWQTAFQGTQAIQTVKSTSEITWLGYRHVVPRDEDWRAIVRGEAPNLAGYQGQLMTDFYEYNDSSPSGPDSLNWVGDLALEAHVEVLGDAGELLFDIIEGGIHHQCKIDVTTGMATLTLDDGRRSFGEDVREIAGQTAVRGRGSYVLRFANVDDELFLWVNQKLVTFTKPPTFDSPHDLVPTWSEQDPGDFVPLRVGARQTEVRINRLRVFRDVYYIAASIDDNFQDSDYSPQWAAKTDELLRVITNPHSWSTTDLFSTREEVTYSLQQDQFFPMGDNSPQSKDGRLWSNRFARIPPPHVDREMLIGKAVFIYWPHGWRIFTDAVGIIPNFQKIGRIR